MASPYASEIEVVQAALHRIGEATIASLNDGSLPAQIASSNYEGVVTDYLTRHAWTFATKTVDLTYVGTTDDLPWQHVFTAPAVLNIREIKRAGRTLESEEWTLQDGKVLVMCEDPLKAVTTYRATEGVWAADFAEAIVIRLQAVFLEGLVDKWQDARLKEKDAEGKLLRAIVRDKRQVPSRRAERSKLADVWRGFRRPGY